MPGWALQTVIAAVHFQRVIDGRRPAAVIDAKGRLPFAAGIELEKRGSGDYCAPGAGSAGLTMPHREFPDATRVIAGKVEWP
jgi:hypothetical protein